MIDTLLSRLNALDLAVFIRLNQDWRSENLNPLMVALSGSVVLWGIVACFALLLLRLKYRLRARDLLIQALLLGLCVGTADISANMVKEICKRPRPQHCLPNVHYLVNGQWRANSAEFTPIASKSSSFYSGHAVNSMAVAATLAAFVPQAAPLVYVIPLAVGYSRVYLGKHYPSDVLFGWLTGWCISMVYLRLFRRASALLRGRKRFPQAFRPALRFPGKTDFPLPAERNPAFFPD
ncbi:MAG: phosphatase PAP2 family protein [Deltaproteobacteria bacterium]|jgi:undecaprenyl-diphosphatase|nr:phosphatase PAP2 family protein [Deltaproteobacteria bacterium]